MKDLLNKLGNLTKHTSLKLGKYTPDILMGLGIIGAVASTVLACKATLKVKDILEEKNEQLETVNTVEKDALTDDTIDYSEEDGKKDRAIIYTQTGVKLLKEYAPAIGLGVLSIATIISSHNIMKKRNITLAAAYTAINTSFKKYRKNVVERFGKEIDKELRFGVKAVEVESKYTDKKGNEKTKKEKVKAVENPIDGVSEYARFFDECTSTEWRKDSEYNKMFLRRSQDYANEMLKHRGHIFLNEVYDMLGMPRSKAGQAVGWVYDKENPNGDNYVDFGLYDVHRLPNHLKEPKEAFINGTERSILLDFNVDGAIYDLI